MLRLSYTPPTDYQFSHMEFSIRHCPIGGSYTTTPIIVQGGTSGNDQIDVVAGQQYEVTPITVTKGGFRIFPDGTATQVVRNIGSPVTLAVPIGTAEPNFGTPSADANFVYYVWTKDLLTAYMEVFSATFATDPGSVETVEAPANYVPPTLDSSKNALQLAVTSGLPWRVTTFVPYNQRAVRGVPQTFKTQRNASAGTTAAPSLSVFSNPSTYNGSIEIKITFNTTPSVGDSIHLYRSGVQVNTGAIYTVTAIDITNGYYLIIDTTVPAAATTYTYVATQLTGGSLGTSSGLSVTSGAQPTLTAPPTPTIFIDRVQWSPPVLSCLGYDVDFNINATGNPAGTVYDVYTSNDGTTFTLLSGNTGLTPDSNGNVSGHANRDTAAHTAYGKALARLTGYTSSSFSGVGSAAPAGSGCR
jgi:hypothetical protein